MNTEQIRAEFEAWYEKQMGEAPRIAEDTYTPFATACWEAYQAGRAALQSQDREDAERYRWLRNGRNYKHSFLIELGGRTDRSFDAAIDHARRGEDKL